ncbi:GNAT family N-acetyltransferase [bacterium]|nr:GNAT family N-acetyltransferase [bacterium]
MNIAIHTTRLELIAATTELLQSENDHNQLAAGLQADVPENWPMPLYDSNARSYFTSVLTENPDALGWTSWYILLLEPDQKTLIGAVGACGLPDDEGKIVIGYSILDQFQRKGYATEALRGFLNWAKSNPRLRVVAADTYPHLLASIRVLEKSGFISCGHGIEEGSIGFRFLV